MKLIECYVSSFGKLKNYKYNFNDNLNVINEQNGFGKTTLSIFIKSMFYGLEDSRRSVEENERKKYKPWNSTEKFGGYVIFEKNGTQYKLERFFGSKESEDDGKLTELSTGKIFTDVSNVKKYANYPMRVKVSSERQVKWVKELISQVLTNGDR